MNSQKDSGKLAKGENIEGNVLVDPSAKVDPTAKLGPNVVVGKDCVVEAGVRL